MHGASVDALLQLACKRETAATNAQDCWITSPDDHDSFPRTKPKGAEPMRARIVTQDLSDFEKAVMFGENAERRDEVGSHEFPVLTYVRESSIVTENQSQSSISPGKHKVPRPPRLGAFLVQRTFSTAW